MSAMSYPEPAAPPADAPRVAQIPTAPRSRIGIISAIGVATLLAATLVAYLLWPRQVTPQTELLLAGAAEQVVTAFLHGDRPALEQLISAEIPDTLTPGRFYVRSTAALSMLDTEAGWEVLVAADRLMAVPGGFGDPRTEHYLVAFHDRPTGAVAIGLPGLVPGPEAPPVRAAAWPSPPSDQVTAAVDSYFGWLLTGQSGVFDGAPVTPAPFVNAAIVGMQRIERDGGLDVLVAVEGVRSDGTVMPLHYQLRLEPAETGWAVSRPGS